MANSPRHTPSIQTSSTVLRIVSLQEVKSSSGGPTEHSPRKHVGQSRHDCTGHTTPSHGSSPAQTPAPSQTSSTVRALPSSHGVPAARNGPVGQTPRTHVPGLWHWDTGAHVTPAHVSTPSQKPSPVHDALTTFGLATVHGVPGGAIGSVHTALHTPRSRAAKHVPAARHS